ncbi:MAG: ABC transporter ATP-binding protein [Clostridiales bacterium]|jgi:NitT/TauT family transport system ATP-binding protein|nr:ABC transporter ATP-binding protein [Eubacteriales bacterium]MDH7566740.1 ABC transporter ATP-binding protein [Clostridiales bacterium]
MLEIKGLTVKYKVEGKECLALHHLDMKLEEGDICAVIGPSGCGKSTLLHVLSGILSDYSGLVTIDGGPVDPKQKRIGFVPQNYGLLEWANAYDNALLGLDIKHESRLGQGPYIEYILKQLGLWDIRSKYPSQLSGGQKQRIAIARSFILKPHLLLMDEPFSALDAITREEIQDLFLEVWKENKVSTVFVTHSMEEAVYIGRKIAVMSPSPGRIVKVLENPLFGAGNLRLRDEYYRFVMELRKMAKEEWSN